VPETTPTARRLYVVLGSNSLPYASLCVESLFRNASEPLAVTFVTDGEEDRARVTEAVGVLPSAGSHPWMVVGRAETDDRAAANWGALPALRQFRDGHPCWRKITDPLLLAGPGEEVVVLDPDVYFPNRFTFEPTPAGGLLLMWQPPHCLLPHETVERAYALPVRLAHHADIGVAQWANAVDLDWLNWLVAGLGGAALPPVMHIEVIVWAAAAMRFGGGYLNPRHWYCWRNRHWKRLARAVGVSGVRMLAAEPFGTVKCFHAGGAAKWWLRDAADRGLLGRTGDVRHSLPVLPYRELTRSAYRRGQAAKRLARAIGYR
jgi:hypothetical protein